MKELGVNVDHVATLREARKTSYPDPITAASLAELAGAHQITVHLREDRRHIQERDVKVLREVVKTRLNLEMALTTDMVKFALNVNPDCVTLVPERREELTTEGGLEVNLNKDSIRKAIDMLKDSHIQVSLFVDPDLDQVKASHMVNADAVEIHTGSYCNARTEKDKKDELQRISDAIRLAKKVGLRTAAGHGLDYHNIGPVALIHEIKEFNIGHSIISRAILVGMDRAVQEMLVLINPNSNDVG